MQSLKYHSLMYKIQRLQNASQGRPECRKRMMLGLPEPLLRYMRVCRGIVFISNRRLKITTRQKNKIYGREQKKRIHPETMVEVIDLSVE